MSDQSAQKHAYLPLNRTATPRRNPLIYSRWPLLMARAITLAGFVLTIFSGLFGSVVGSQNFAIIFVWISWWTALKLLFIPLGGRSWCAVCPIPMPGEWISQGGIFPGGKKIGLGRKWPKHLRLGKQLGTINLRGTWLQSGGFLMIGLFSAVTLTTPTLTGWVLLGIIVLSLVLSLVFERRAFCNHLCPIGGFTGLYAQAAPVEIRAKDRSVCAAHNEKACYQNCPWGVYVTALRDNGPCGMCMECIRVCPHDNVSINLREFGKDFIETRKSFQQPLRLLRLDEAFLALVMLACALAFSAVFLGPWGVLRRAAYDVGSNEWMVYSAGFLLFAGLLIPGLYAILLRLGGPVEKLGKSMARFSRPLLPLGLATWIAFTTAFAFAKISYMLPVLSDPFGRGWNLFGTAGIVWAPDVSILSPILQTVVLLGGLLWMGQVARKAADTPRRAVSLQVFGFLITIGMFLLLVG